MGPTTSPVDNSSDSTQQDMASTVPTTPDTRSSPDSMLCAEQQSDSSDSTPSHLGLSPSQFSGGLAEGSSSILPETCRRVRSICCIGAGYVGGPTAAIIAYQNPHIRVTVVDRDAGRIRRWNSRHLPIYEQGLYDIVQIARDGGRALAPANVVGISDSDDRQDTGASTPSEESETKNVLHRRPNLFFSTEVQGGIADADLVFIAVNTPTKPSGVGAGCATDMAAFEAVTHEVARHARAGAIIVEKSTVPCGTARLVKEMLAVHRPGVAFEILSNPEFLAAGTAVHDLTRPDRVLIGSDRTPSGRAAAAALADVYAAWVPRARIIATDVFSSELAKLAANAMLAQRVSSINSISAICEETGADAGEVGRAVGSDARIGGAFLRAGLGFGGSCFKKDVLSLAYLADSVGLAGVAEYWRQVVAMNEDQRDRFSRRVVRCLNNTLVGKKLTFLGYAFKANTSDVRESPTSDVVRRLRSERPREIAIFDPCCDPAVVRREIGMILQDPSVVGRGACPVVVYSDVYEACEASNAVIVTTECDQFRNKELKAALCPARRKSRDRFDVGRFTRQGQSGMDILDCHGPFLWSFPVLAHEGEDPLPGPAEEPSCDEDCPECEAIKMGGRKAGGHGAAENVDWHKIAYRMTKPKWLFDGRGIIDAEEMAKLDVHVEIIGSQGKA